MALKYLNFINGEWLDGAGLAPNVNPSDLSDRIGDIALADEAMAQSAIEAASDAAAKWRNSGTEARADILDQVGARLLEKKDEYGKLLSREQGKPIAEGIGEAVRAGRIFKFFAGEAVRLHGKCGASIRNGVDVRVDRKPVGVVGLITPWNFPLAIPAWKAAPALAFGNTVVLKPAQLTPACANIIAELLHDAGAPAGVFNLVHGSGSLVGNALVVSKDVDALSFTGSEGVGNAIRMARAETGKKCQLELGGKNPLIIADDADLDIAVEITLNGAFGGTGQKCTASSRIIVMSSIYDEFVRQLQTAVTALRVGHALEPDTQVGPLADENQLRTVQSFVERAHKEGARVIGGDTPTTKYDGYYLRPALFADADPDSESSREEIFGPCASLIKVNDFDEAINQANDTRFGLSAGICTQSLARADRFRQETRTGLAMINLPTAGVDYHVPFGGIKSSGYGPKEQGAAAIEFYSTLQTTYCAPGNPR